jgi:hypothetical protein
MDSARYILIAILLIAGCSSDFRADIAIEGLPAQRDGIIVSLEQYVVEGEVQPMNGLLLSGGVIDNLIEQLPPGFQYLGECEQKEFIKQILDSNPP